LGLPFYFLRTLASKRNDYMADALMSTYAPLPVSFEKGEGCWLWDTDGRKYLDAVGGIAVCALGHAHPAVTEAVCKQASTLVHTSNLYTIDAQRQAAGALTAVAGMDKVFFGNSGAEANEAAIKIARLYGHSRDIKLPVIVVTENSFHGRTLATLTATGNRKVQAGFEPLVPGFVRVPYNDLEAIRTVAKNNNDVVAVLVEPLQGEGGVNVPDAGYLGDLREICDDNDWLLMLDEIQTGLCRTGAWFAFQHDNIIPDVMSLAKSLGNGVPVGACLARGKAAEVMQPGSHGSTFGGNPLASAAVMAVLTTMTELDLAKRSKTLGQAMLTAFDKRLGDNPQVIDIRGKGLMIGIELAKPCGELVKAALDKGLLVNVTAEKVIRLLPSLLLSDDESAQIVDQVCDLVETFVSQNHD